MRAFICGLLLALSTLTQNPGPSKGGSASAQPPIYVGVLDGSTNVVASGTTTALSPTAMSFNVWINIAVDTMNFAMIGYSPGGDMQMSQLGDYPCLYITTPSVVGGCASTHGYAAGNGWVMLTATCDAATGLNLYVNTVLVLTPTSSCTLTAASGALQLGYAGAGNIYHGEMSDFRMYNRALSLTDITNLYTRLPVTSGLIGEWKLNEGTGSTAIDSTSGGNNLTWYGTQTGTSGYYSSVLPY